MLSCFHLIPERDKRTDGRTDRIAISISWVSILTRDKNYNTETVLLIFLFLQTNITSQMWPSGVGGPEVRGGSSLGRRHSPPLTNAQASKFLDLLDDNGYERWYLISVLINTNAGGKGLPPPTKSFRLESPCLGCDNEDKQAVASPGCWGTACCSRNQAEIT